MSRSNIIMSTPFSLHSNNNNHNDNNRIPEYHHHHCHHQQQTMIQQKWNNNIKCIKIIPFIFIIILFFSFFISKQMNDTIRSLTQLTTSMMYENNNNYNYYYETSLQLNNDNTSNVLNRQYNSSNSNVSFIDSFVRNNSAYSNVTVDRTIDDRENMTTSSNQVIYNNDYQYHNPLVWLLSFPNSGTTYTLHLIQEITNTTTATNYGKEQVGSITSIPINPNEPNGPYYRSLELNTPRRQNNNTSTITTNNNHSVSNRHNTTTTTTPYILTKSHCEPHHIDVTKKQFAKSCSTGDRKVNHEVEKHIIYNYHIANIQKIIHLIRNPFDNIVARMHYEQKKWIKFNTSDDIEKLKFFTNTIEGFGLWCMYKDKLTENHHQLNYILQKFQTNMNTNFTSWNDIYDQDGTIPFCITEFYRYLQWHNYVVELTTRSNETMKEESKKDNQKEKDMDVNDDDDDNFEDFPVMYLYYENYTQITESIIPSSVHEGTLSMSETDNNTLQQLDQLQNMEQQQAKAKDIVSKNNVIKELLQFLNFDIDIDVIDLPAPFIQGKTYYTTYYTDDERQLLSKYAKNYLSPKAWRLLEHYFIT